MIRTHATRTIDDFGRLLLPINLRGYVNWKPGDTLVTLVDSGGRMLVLYKTDAIGMEIDSHGRITITKELMSQLGWEPNSRIRISLRLREERMVLQKE